VAGDIEKGLRSFQCCEVMSTHLVKCVSLEVQRVVENSLGRALTAGVLSRGEENLEDPPRRHLKSYSYFGEN